MRGQPTQSAHEFMIGPLLGRAVAEQSRMKQPNPTKPSPTQPNPTQPRAKLEHGGRLTLCGVQWLRACAKRSRRGGPRESDNCLSLARLWERTSTDDQVDTQPL